MAISPLSESMDKVTVSVKIDGKPIAGTIGVSAIRVAREINSIATAEIHLVIPVGTADAKSFFHTNSYSPGQDIQLAAGYQSKDENIFEGMIVSQQISGQSTGEHHLILKCSHKAVKLQTDPSSSFFEEKRDSEIIGSLISKAGLHGEVEVTPDQHKQLIQYETTDWDFIISRASTNGLLVYTEGDGISVKPPLSSGEADLILTFGKDVIAFSHSHSAQAEKKGQLSFVGNAKPAINTMIELAGFGKQYSGKVLITKVNHEITDGSWQTSIGYGLLPVGGHEHVSAGEERIAGTKGLLVGTVMKLDADPEGEYRILVEVPAIASSGDGIWARLSNFYSTSKKGAFFMPEVGDEIVLGFLNDDPRYPIILGSLYSSKTRPPYSADVDNSIKAIVTKNDLKLEFNDKDKTLTIETPARNRFILSDKDKSITTQDQNGNKIVMDHNGIHINSARDIIFKATGKIEITGDKSITAKSSSNVSIEGLNVNLKAQVALSAEGSASAILKADGQTTVQGAIVMIN